VFGVFALACLWSTLTRNVVALDGKTRRFFTNMPAVMQRIETGETALAGGCGGAGGTLGWALPEPRP
jgi:hypothetical protein